MNPAWTPLPLLAVLVTAQPTPVLGDQEMPVRLERLSERVVLVRTGAQYFDQAAAVQRKKLPLAVQERIVLRGRRGRFGSCTRCQHRHPDHHRAQQDHCPDIHTASNEIYPHVFGLLFRRG